jgi:CRISPR-associated protein Cas2
MKKSAQKYFTVICYDITLDRKRVRVMKYLKGVGYHVQKSVFEAFLDKKQLDQVKKKVMKMIDMKTDSVRFYVLMENSPLRVHVVGQGEVSQLKNIIVIT